MSTTVAATIRRQIGGGNILAISGGRIEPTSDGLVLPVGRGYSVRVTLDRASDTYTVERVFTRSQTEFIHGKRTGVHADQVGEVAYRASCFSSYTAEEW